VIAAVLLLLGIGCAAGYRVAASGEHHSFAASGVPPASSEVTTGKTYFVAVPGGVDAFRRAGLDADHLQCQWAAPDAGAQLLAVVPLGSSTKATDAIATFLAPYTGRMSVTCVGWGPVFIDDADDAPADYAGVLLLLATIGFTLGVPIALAALRNRRRSVRPPSEDEEVERLVHVVHVRAEDEEVLGTDGGDVRE
jgi:hypothetical protein